MKVRSVRVLRLRGTISGLILQDSRVLVEMASILFRGEKSDAFHFDLRQG